MSEEKYGFRIIKFSSVSKEASVRLDAIIDECCIDVDNWLEKDYGLILYAIAPEYHLDRIRRELGNIHGVLYSEY